MNAPKRSRAHVLRPEGLKKLREQIRSHEAEENSGFKYTLERLGELTGLDPETVKNVLDGKGSDKRTIARCFESFGLTLEDSDHIPATQAVAATADPNFVGRDEALMDLNALVSRQAKVIVIQARGGVGKTTLARKYLQQEFGSFLEFPIAKETKDIASIEVLIEEKLRQLGEEPGREFLVSLDRLKRKLQAERIGILIDNLEPALDSAGKFIEAHRRYVELLRVLSDPSVKSLTLITSRERLREADVTVQHYALRSLDVQAWEQFFQSRNINVETPALAALHNAYGGNAKAMDILSGAVLEDFSGDVEAYWQANQEDLFIERDLEDLVTKQFDRLQQLDSDAYKLLCRMGCYRYQDVPTVPIAGLFCLLWDIPENRHRRVIKSLQDRSLIDFEDGEFWLHPVIRAEAIIRLRAGEEWNTANRKAAEFWTQNIKTIETLKEALRAFEAYHHYMMINDFNMSGVVIVNQRPNQWEGNEPLGRSFYRLGVLQQTMASILEIVHKVNPGYVLSRLYNMLGGLFWLTGSPNKAIEAHKKSGLISKEFLENNQESKQDGFWFKRLTRYALFNIGLCNLDLWELEISLQYFEEVLAIFEKDCSSENGFYTNEGGMETWCCLAFTTSYLSDRERAFTCANFAYNSIASEKLDSWATGYCPLLLGSSYKNLGDFKKAFEMYEKAMSYSEESHYKQVRAKALTGLAEPYRDQLDFKKAISHHSESIEYLKEISAKCDLAEAFYQLGLTYQVMSNFEGSVENFQEAIQLFTEMEAPKQVERVRQSMQNWK